MEYDSYDDYRDNRYDDDWCETCGDLLIHCPSWQPHEEAEYVKLRNSSVVVEDAITNQQTVYQDDNRDLQS